MKIKDAILTAARADAIPAGESGLWIVRKIQVATPLVAPRSGGRTALVPAGSYTQLYRWTEATMHLVGELVMHDFPDELNTHLNFMLRCSGRVLITGLGLGCCVRGALANPRVRHVTVVEREAAVLALVAPFMPQDDRLRIVHADALEWIGQNADPFDWAWHDLWSNEDAGEPHLQLIHSRLICALIERTKKQGAWALPRIFRRRTGFL